MKAFQRIYTDGSYDEQATTDAFEEYVGGVAKAQHLLRIYKNSYPKSLFRSAAKIGGFKDEHVDAMLMMQ